MPSMTPGISLLSTYLNTTLWYYNHHFTQEKACNLERLNNSLKFTHNQQMAEPGFESRLSDT